MRSAQERIRRILYTSLGIAALAYTLLGVADASAQFAVLLPGWGALDYIVTSALSVSLAFLGPIAPMRVLAVIASAHCAAFALTVLFWVPMMTQTTLPDHAQPWTFGVVTIAVSAAAIAWPPVAAWTYLVVTSVATGVVRYAAAQELGWVSAVQDGLFAMTLSAIVVAIIRVSRTSGCRLDRAWMRARDEVAREAGEASARRQRVRTNALIHDQVLSLLFAAARQSGPSRDELREAAASTLHAFAPVDSGADVSGDELVARVRAGAEGEAFDWWSDVAADACVPGEVAAAILEAAGEAMRNSVAHAGARVRGVQIVVSSTGVRVVVGDDGRGFLPRRVAADRLGVRVSIIERMRAAGGDAHVDSAPGAGTRIVLEWTRGADR